MSARAVMSVMGYVQTGVQTLIQGIMGLPGGTSGKESTCQCRRRGFNSWVGKTPGGGHGNPLQYS